MNDKDEIKKMAEAITDYNILADLYVFLMERAKINEIDLYVYHEHGEYKPFHEELIKLLAAKPDATVLEVGPAVWGLKAAKELAVAKELKDKIKNWSFVEKIENMPSAYSFSNTSLDEAQRRYFDSEEYAFLKGHGAKFHHHGLESLSGSYDFIAIIHGFAPHFGWLTSSHVTQYLNPGGVFLSIGERGACTHAERGALSDHRDLEIKRWGGELITFKAQKNA